MRSVCNILTKEDVEMTIRMTTQRMLISKPAPAHPYIPICNDRVSSNAFQFNLVILQRFDDGQTFYVFHASLGQYLATALEFLFDDKAHAHEFGTCLLAEVDDAYTSIAKSQEVIDK